ncbi:MAG: SET domain-containing protein-lysine N-methyltransferase [Minisyncoccia bacterium]
MKKYHSWISPKLEVRDIQDFGKGVYAKEDVLKDEILAIFGGYVMTLDEEQELPPHMRDFAHQIAPNFVIGINKDEDIQPVDYFNHSCNPNAGFKGQIFLLSMNNINKDEQITFDYSMVLSVETYKFDCQCGSENCRKVVRGTDWMLKALQEKYKGYFQWYLEEKIKKLNATSIG